MPSPQNKAAPAPESGAQLDGKGKGQSGHWNLRAAGGPQLHQHQSPYIVVNSPAAICPSPYLRALLHENKQAVVIHPIPRDSASQSSALHLVPSTASSSSSSSSILNMHPTRLFPIMSKHKQQQPVAPGFTHASLGWVQHAVHFGKAEEDAASKKSSESAYVQEQPPTTEKSQNKSSSNGRDKDSTDLLHSVHCGSACKFPRCEKTFPDHRYFLRPMYSNQHLDDKSTVQCLIQTEVVHSLEEQLAVEKYRLHEMQSLMTGKLGTVHNPKQRERSLVLQQSHHPGVSALPGLDLSAPLPKEFPDTVLALRRHLWEGSSSNIYDNRTNCIEYYKTNNVRPPLTYASLIRWAILESPQKQLALNEIYHWFTKMFAFFRLNKVTWKNAVRHNLSLHKCFVRVENMRGAVWMVDELEFQRKRGLRGSR
ncbi:forkhead box protein P3 isoform X2 [Pseudophryne corroboree]|uniref:forkhead box protein P3 isoform X2 n=1 Tax=Pseudophryne corroboree TaxID=495146 RepID=UPI0030819AE8